MKILLLQGSLKINNCFKGHMSMGCIDCTYFFGLAAFSHGLYAEFIVRGCAHLHFLSLKVPASLLALKSGMHFATQNGSRITRRLSVQ